MKVYYNFGNEDYTKGEFEKYLIFNQFRLGIGKINSLRILERKFLSNKGNALDGTIKVSKSGTYGLNIGGNPTGTGYTNYIQFLEEMKCKKVGGLYRISSLENHLVAFIERNNNLRGIIVPEALQKEIF